MPTKFARTRRRIKPYSKRGQFLPLGQFYWRPGGINGPWVIASDVMTRIQETPFLHAKITADEVHSGPPYMEGGPFLSLSYDCELPKSGLAGYGTYIRNDNLQKYVGGFCSPGRYSFGLTGSPDEFDLEGQSPDLLTETSTNIPTMSGWGSKAWSSTKPKLEKASGFVFGSEIRDLPRMLKTTSRGFHDLWKSMGGKSDTRIMQPKKLANHFLNHQFGWVPFVSDLRKFNHVIQNSQKMISDISSRNNLWTRKRSTLKTEYSDGIKIRHWQNQIICHGFAFSPGYFSSQPFAEMFESKTLIITAVGSFKYYRPEFDSGLIDYQSSWNSAMRHLTIAGFRVNPSNLYAATPWTWAIDWISNVGDHVDHLSDIWADSIANKYLYVMQHKKTVRKIIQTLPFVSGTVPLTFSRIIESKQRQEGSSPYGFSLSLSDLTPRQLAIAGALGISRL